MGSRPRAVVASLALVAVLVAGCSGGGGSSSTTEEAPTGAATSASAAATTAAAATTTTASPADAATVAAIQQAIDAGPADAHCDPLDPRACYLPYPSNASAVEDATSTTGLRVAMAADGLPANAKGVPIDPAEWNRNDGFSPNSSILTYVPALDPAASNLPSWTDLGASLDDDATVVLVELATGERVPLYAEPDAGAASDADRALIIHPAVALAENARYVVALRGLKGTDGAPVEPGAVFRAYRDRLTTDLPQIEDRRPAMEEDLAALEKAGIGRDDLQLAWDFTTASEESLSGRMLHIRDDALAALGDAAPAFTVTAITPNTDDNVAMRIDGTFTVPNYLTGDGGPGNRFHYDQTLAADPDALPNRNGEHPTLQAPFVCIVSTSTAAGAQPAHLVEYGHGLLGDPHEIEAGNVRAFADEHDAVVCATAWAGMSEPDVPNAIAVLNDISLFPSIADRLQQGVLDQIFLGRLMTRPGGLATVAQLRRADGSSMIDTAHLDYDGNSQGGIMGLMLAAVSPDLERAVLGVPGMNYSLLLPRSNDWTTYEAVLKPAYPNDLDRTFIVSLLQMLWDRGEGAGYAQHVTADPYEGTRAKPILMHVAFGDAQVSELAAFVEARTMGIPIQRPVTAPGRSEEVEPGWGMDSLKYPSDGSGIVVWDSGAAPIPIPDVAPTGRDPHEDPRADPMARQQKAEFLFDDTLVDVCGGQPCTAQPVG